MATKTLKFVFDDRIDHLKAIDPETGNGFLIARLVFVESDHLSIEAKRRLVADIVATANPITGYVGK